MKFYITEDVKKSWNLFKEELELYYTALKYVKHSKKKQKLIKEIKEMETWVNMLNSRGLDIYKH